MQLDATNSTPLWEQVAAEIRRAIAEGEAKPGERMPLVKDLATVLGVNRNTVLRALHQLRDEGLLEIRQFAWMRLLLASDLGRGLYEKRHQTIEPVFGQIKYNRRIDRFQRRGRTAVRSEWRLAAMTHNLLKLHQHRAATAGP